MGPQNVPGTLRMPPGFPVLSRSGGTGWSSVTTQVGPVTSLSRYSPRSTISRRSLGLMTAAILAIVAVEASSSRSSSRFLAYPSRSSCATAARTVNVPGEMGASPEISTRVRP